MTRGDPIQVVKLTDGTTISLYEDGLKVQRSNDGTTVEVYPDGTRKTFLPDGVSIEARPDGSKTQVNADSTVIDSFADGRIEQVNPDGTKLITYPDGSKLQNFTNGIVMQVFADSSRLQTFPDGTQIRVDEKGEKFQKTPDGTTFWCKANGIAEVVENDTYDWGTKRNPLPPPRPPSPPSAGEDSSQLEQQRVETTKPSVQTLPPPPSAPPPQPVRKIRNLPPPPPPSVPLSSGDSTKLGTSERNQSGSNQSFDTHQSKNEDFEKKIAKLELENRQLKLSARQAESQFAGELQKQMAKSHDDMTAILEELAQAKENAQKAAELEHALLKATEAMESQRKSLNTDLETEKKSHAETEVTLAKMKQDLKENEERFHVRLKEETESLRAQVKDLEENNRKVAQELQRGGAEDSARLTEMSAKLASVENQLRESQGAVKDLSDKLGKTDLIRSQSEERKAALELQLSQTKETLATTERQVEDLHGQVEDLIFKGGSCAEQLIALRKERDLALNEKEESYHKLADLTQKMVETVASLAERENDLASAFDQITKLRQDASIAKDASLVNNALVAERERSANLESQLKQILGLTEKLDKVLGSTQLSENLNQTTKKGQTDTIAVLQSQSDALKRQLNYSESTAKSLQAKLDSTTDANSELQKQIDALKAEQTVRASFGGNVQVGELQKEIAGLQAKLSATTRDLEQSRKQCQELEKLQSFSTEPIATVIPTSPPGSPAIHVARHEAVSRPPGLSFLNDIKGGGGTNRLNHVASSSPKTASISPSLLKSVGSVSPNSTSLSELASLKAKQRASQTQRIDDLLGKQKQLSKKETSGNGASSELAQILAARRAAAS